jgi:uncharacterized protein YgiM (DUF1202 family)
MPEGAKEGEWTITTTVELRMTKKSVKVEETTRFIVRSEIVYVKEIRVSLREGPGSKFKIIAQVPQGTKLEVIGHHIEGTFVWLKVKWEHGQVAWVAGNVVASSNGKR